MRKRKKKDVTKRILIIGLIIILLVTLSIATFLFEVNTFKKICENNQNKLSPNNYSPKDYRGYYSSTYQTQDLIVSEKGLILDNKYFPTDIQIQRIMQNNYFKLNDSSDCWYPQFPQNNPLIVR